MIPRHQITGLVLAGGMGRRMGGVDKGLQPMRGQPLARIALDRLSPQVATCLVSANRNRSAYEAFGVPVLADPMPGHPGPLAGLLAGLRHCTTDWLLAVPCDAPDFPADLAARLGEAVAPGGIAMAATHRDNGTLQHQPVFCLLARSLESSLAAFVAEGGASPWAWASRTGMAVVLFEDATAFANANTPEELRRLGY